MHKISPIQTVRAFRAVIHASSPLNVDTMTFDQLFQLSAYIRVAALSEEDFDRVQDFRRAYRDGELTRFADV